MSWGLTGLTSPSNELRSEGNIQHSCAYSEGWGKERHAATLSGTGQVSPLKSSTESLFAFIRNVCLGTKIKISPVARDGRKMGESELDGDKRFFTGREATNPVAVREYSSGSTANQR